MADPFSGGLGEGPTLRGRTGERPWTLQPGAVLGGYRVVEPLGRGGMGEVYLVEHERMGKRYALKVIRPSAPRTRSSGSASRSRRESWPTSSTRT